MASIKLWGKLQGMPLRQSAMWRSSESQSESPMPYPVLIHVREYSGDSRNMNEVVLFHPVGRQVERQSSNGLLVVEVENANPIRRKSRIPGAFL